MLPVAEALPIPFVPTPMPVTEAVLLSAEGMAVPDGHDGFVLTSIFWSLHIW